MRRITKGRGHRTLNARNEKPPQNSNESESAWSNFRKKAETRNECLKEQFYLCGYSEISLTNICPIVDELGNQTASEFGCHLEHIEPKSLYPTKTFLHQNIVASAIDNREARGIQKKEVFGGHAKQGWYKEGMFISPISEICSNFFHYETTGKIVPNAKLDNRRDKAKARLTIYILNLNSPILVNLRNIWLNELDKLIDGLDLDSLIKFAEVELLPVNGKLRPFHSAQKQLFGKIGLQICSEHNL